MIKWFISLLVSSRGHDWTWQQKIGPARLVVGKSWKRTNMDRTAIVVVYFFTVSVVIITLIIR